MSFAGNDCLSILARIALLDKAKQTTYHILLRESQAKTEHNDQFEVLHASCYVLHIDL
jgi:hypothetical protein